MKTLLLSVVLTVSFHGFSQTTIKLSEVKNHIGDSVQVEGAVSGARFLETADKSPTFINIGGAYPKNLLTVVIWGVDRKRFSLAPEDAFKNKTIRITGRLLDYNGKPEIVVVDPKQIIVIDK